MDGPADTLNYMIAGYTVIFSIMLGYAASIWVRWKRLKRQLDDLEDRDGD